MGKRKPSGSSVTALAREAVTAVADITCFAALPPGDSRNFILDIAVGDAIAGYPGAGITEKETSDSRANLEHMVTVRCNHVKDAKVYIMENEALDVTVAATDTVRLRDIKDLNVSDLPAAEGFLMLPRNLYFTSYTSTTGAEDIRAISWRIGNISQDGTWEQGLRFSLWSDTFAGVGDAGYVTAVNEMLRKNTWLPRLIHDSYACHSDFTRFAAGDLLDASPSELSALADTRYIATGSRVTARTNEVSEVISGTYDSGAPIHDPTNTFVGRFMFAFSRLCAQDNGFDVTKIRDKVPAIGHRSDRERPEDLVSIASLHPRRGVGDGTRGGPVNWSNRWVVKMHARRQWYPSKGKHEVIFVGPYVKGPEGKPMKRGGGPTPPSVTVVR